MSSVNNDKHYSVTLRALKLLICSNIYRKKQHVRKKTILLHNTVSTLVRDKTIE